MEAAIKGTLALDPELVETHSGKRVVRVRVAVNTPDDQPTLFLDAEAWNEAADRIAARLRKGDPVTGTATWARTEWVDKETGKTRGKNFLRLRSFGPDLTRCDVQGVTRLQRAADKETSAEASTVPADPMDED